MSFASDQYRKMDATALAESIRNGEVSAQQALEQAWQQIDFWQPKLNALVWQDRERAAAQLKTLDATAPFAGVPLLLKDTAPNHLAGAPTTDGCAAHRNRIPERNSYMVERLIRAGFIIVGKTNVPEFCLKGTTEPQAFGATRNPWSTDHITGGSSGGSAAAVAAGMVPVATASDGGGSIRIPAAYCGLIGLKPTRGRVSEGPQLGQLWDGMSTDHVLVRSVRDSAALLDVLAGAEPGDPHHAEPPTDSFLNLMQRDPGKLRIALDTRSPLGNEVDPDIRRITEQTAEKLAALGHTVEEARPEVDGKLVARCYLMLYAGQVACELEDIRAQHGAAGLRQTELDSRVLALLGNSFSAGDYARHLRHWNTLSRQFAALFNNYDLYLTPTTAQPPARIGEQDLPAGEALGARLVTTLGAGKLLRATGLVDKMAEQALQRVPFTQLGNFCGTPGISLPMGFCGNDKLPVGVQLTAQQGQEGLLLQVARQLEESSQWRTLASA
ncbi:amidase [Alcanivorax sp. 1008]|uniref:amidase n=1 Tax=Alcanivorax sp. 1008 TaxID=2816853 RepID=UPI001D6C8D52|nr:amidase [Alcanivorax sp. 1008]MCC1495812.1 amidase [Alcanivorax sp. 1008]